VNEGKKPPHEPDEGPTSNVNAAMPSSPYAQSSVVPTAMAIERNDAAWSSCHPLVRHGGLTVMSTTPFVKRSPLPDATVEMPQSTDATAVPDIGLPPGTPRGATSPRLQVDAHSMAMGTADDIDPGQ